MNVIYKNKGILVPVFFAVPAIGCGAILISLHRNLANFPEVSIQTSFGITFLISAVWTYLAKDTYYRDEIGNKHILDVENSFYFIGMKIWAYIFLVLSFSFFVYNIIKK